MGKESTMRPIPLKRSFEVRFSPGGEVCVSISRDVKALRVASRKRLFTSHPLSHPSHLSFSPDGLHLAVKSTSGRTVILDGMSGEVATDFENDRDGEGSNIVFSSCGDFTIDGGWDGVVRVRDRKDGRIVFERGFHATMIQSVCSAQQGALWLTSHSPKPTTHDRPPESAYFLRWIWPFPEAEPEILRFRVPFLRSSALSPDGKFLAVVFGAPPTTLQVFSLTDQMVVHTQSVSSGGSGSAMRWSRCSRYLGFAQKGLLSVVEAPSFGSVCDYPMEYPCSIDFSPDAALVALGSWSSGKITSLEKEKKEPIQSTTDNSGAAPLRV